MTQIIAGARQLQRSPTTLADVAVTKRKTLSVFTDEIKWSGIDGGLKTLFTGKNLIVNARTGLTVNTRFGGAMAKPGGADADEKRVRDGLERVGMLTFKLDDRSGSSATADPVVDSVHFHDLDLDPDGGVDGHYRFSVVVTKKVAGMLTEVDSIENIKPRISLAAKLDVDTRTRLQKRFDAAGQKRGGDDETVGADPAPKWQDPEWDRVLQATAFIPDSMLSPGCPVWYGRAVAAPLSHQGGGAVRRDNVRWRQAPKADADAVFQRVQLGRRADLDRRPRVWARPRFRRYDEALRAPAGTPWRSAPSGKRSATTGARTGTRTMPTPTPCSSPSPRR